MRTRRGACYPGVVSRMCSNVRVTKKKSKDLHMHMHVPAGDSIIYSRKKQKKTPEKLAAGRYDFFESLPDDLVISIFCKLSSTATKPSDFVNVLITCVVSQPLFFSFLHFFFERFFILVFVQKQQV